MYSTSGSLFIYRYNHTPSRLIVSLQVTYTVIHHSHDHTPTATTHPNSLLARRHSTVLGVLFTQRQVVGMWEVRNCIALIPSATPQLLNMRLMTDRCERMDCDGKCVRQSLIRYSVKLRIPVRQQHITLSLQCNS